MRKVQSRPISRSSESSIKERPEILIGHLSNENNKSFKGNEPLSQLIDEGVLCISLKGQDSDQIERFKKELSM